MLTVGAVQTIGVIWLCHSGERCSTSAPQWIPFVVAGAVNHPIPVVQEAVPPLGWSA